MLKRHGVATALTTVLFCTTLSTDALAGPFRVGDFVSRSQDSWGSLGSSAEQILLNHFSEVYPNGVEIGVAGGSGASALFTTVQASQLFLPAGGAAGPLANDYLDPRSTSAGTLAGYGLALTFNVDFNDAGFLSGSSATRFAELTIFNLSAFVVEGVLEDFSDVNGLSLRQFLAAVNTCLGGGSCPHTYEGMSLLAGNLSLAFDGGTPTPFAQAHLQLPDSGPTPAPEPATLSLLGIGLAAVIARHRSTGCHSSGNHRGNGALGSNDTRD